MKGEKKSQLKDHIKMLKERHEKRLKDIETFEKEYFENLNNKLKQLKE